MHFESKILVTGARGMVGSAVLRSLTLQGYKNLLAPSRQELDLCSSLDVDDYFRGQSPEFVFHAAGKVGGIMANKAAQADFFFENAQMGINVLRSAFEHGVSKLLNLGSSCIYPKFAPQPIAEDQLYQGSFEPTNEGYAVALTSVMKYGEFLRDQHGVDFISAMPTNIYGERDNFHPEKSHVIPALVRRFHEAKNSGAKEIVMWGTGEPLREFLYVDDLADGLIYIMQNYSDREVINIGSPFEVSIKDLAHTIRDVLDVDVEIKHDLEKPDGTPRKKLLTGKLENLGWEPKIGLNEGIKKTYEWALSEGHFK
jgi:GDP-L-fucose synthase